jgi:long-chain acyl-CoA synthetase
VRRGFIADRYAPLIEGLYSGAERAFISSVVTFEDGRTGKIEADLAIRDVPRFAARRPVGAAPAALQKAG